LNDNQLYNISGIEIAFLENDEKVYQELFLVQILRDTHIQDLKLSRFVINHLKELQAPS